MLPTVAPADLRVGMYVHLDLGWMRHPFPLSNFRIASSAQIETIRSLGLTQVRWAPGQSVLDAPTAAAPAVDVPPMPTAAEIEAQDRRRALADQRDAARLVERQYGEAAAALREAWRQARDQPAQAAADTQALARALLDKLLVDSDICIRLVNAGNGDRHGAHGLNVAVVALLMGRAFGLGEDDMLELGVGAMLHDIGKLELPDRFRHVDESFSSAETAAYREHVSHGVAIGRRMALAPGALAVIAQHHEHADGSGFPLHLGGDRTTTAARMVAIVNRYDNLCNPALLARALTPHEAVSTMFAQGRSRYDASLLSSFIRMMGVYPAGSTVQLTDDRYAMVVSVNSSRPLKPRVLVHDSRRPRDEALYVDLERVPQLGIRRSLAPAKLPPATLAYLAPRPRVAYFFEALPSGGAEPGPEPEP